MRCEETNSIRVFEKLFQRDQGFTRFPAAFAGRLLQMDAKYFNEHLRKKAKQHNTYRVHTHNNFYFDNTVLRKSKGMRKY